MKYFVLFLLLTIGLTTFAQQEELSMNDAEVRQEVSMGETEGKIVNGVYKYYKKGEDKPFTGILYATYPSGKILSRQEFVDGVGQGTWINYYENGNFKEVGTYEQNKVEGAIKKYYENGQLKSEGTYREWRIRVGEWKYYSTKGELTKTVNHGKKGDFRDVESYYKNGDISKSFYDKLKNS